MDGRLLHVREQDTVVTAGTVVLHAISERAQGPVDSVATGADGRYAFRFHIDSAAIYLLSSRHDGIEYFSTPLRVTRGARLSADVTVHDTSSAAPIGLDGHYWVIGEPTRERRRPVLDLVLLRNAGRRTRVARDSLGASWTMPLPAGAAGVTPGESEFSAAAIEQRGDSLALLSPLVPGERQLMVQYTLPLGTRVMLPVATPAESLVVLLEQSGASVRAPGFAPADTQRIDNRLYRRWVGAMTAPGLIEVRFARTPGSGTLAPLVALLALTMGGALVLALRRRRRAPLPAADRVSGLVEQIAGLDARYAGREGEVDAETWQRYVADRERLRRELDVALAARGAAR